ncbi:MAG: hypothetical protein LBT16_13590 [Treponema sp.]|nr:hypothetical protein [Treponema sp.]
MIWTIPPLVDTKIADTAQGTVLNLRKHGWQDDDIEQAVDFSLPDTQALRDFLQIFYNDIRAIESPCNG